MKKSLIQVCFLMLLGAVALSSCKSRFERIRTSGDVSLIYKTAFELYDKGKYQDAQTLFESIIGNYRGKAEAEKLYYSYAYTHYHLKQFVLASYYFKNFSNTFPNSPKKEEASYLAAYSNFLLSPSYRLDQGYSDKAIEEFQTFVNTYPNSPRVNDCNKLIDGLRKKLEQKAYAEGQLYYDMKDYQAAIRSFENMLKEYPETDDLPRIRYNILQAEFLLAENSVLDKQEERYAATIEYADEYSKKFPKSKNIKEVKSIRKTSDSKLKEIKKYERYQSKSTRLGS